MEIPCPDDAVSGMVNSFNIPFRHLHEWVLPSHGLNVDTMDAHCGGQTLRLILDGFPMLRGTTMLERWRDARDNFDHLRRSLLCEPRGHPEMCGCILTRPQRGDSDFGAVFMHSAGFSPMSGSGIIALTTILLECGMVEMSAPETRIRIDTPAGAVGASGQISDGRVTEVRFESVASWPVAVGGSVELLGFGSVNYDLAYGGAFFAFVRAADLNLSLPGNEVGDLSAAGLRLLKVLRGRVALRHPDDPDPQSLFGVILWEEGEAGSPESADFRQVCVFADGSVDRSPCGMGLCARLALLQHSGGIADGQSLTVEGIMGSRFQGRIIGHHNEGPEGAVICEVHGRAWITGRHTFFISPDDPLRNGFSF